MAQPTPSVLALFGTRPEVIKLAPVLDCLRGARFDVRVVATSQHREMVASLLELFGIRPDHDLQIQQHDQTLADVAARTLTALTPILRDERPDLLLVQGDTSSAFAGALAAFYQKIPVGHVEAGLRSYDVYHPYPEEVNRRLISTVAELHFAPLPSNEANLRREGVEAAKIFVTGNTVIDALRQVAARPPGALAAHVDPLVYRGRRLVLVTAHRRESFGGELAELCQGIRDLVERHRDVVVVYPVHMNPNVRRTVLPLLGEHERIHLVEPLPYDAFVEAMQASHLILTDSGGIQEEAPSLGKPVLVFRKVTEREEGVSASSARIVGLERGALVREAERLLDDAAAYREMTRHRDVYGDGQAARRIVQAIEHHFGRAARPEPFQYRA
jgi:UDP-N-acetylglucosamine 2-epimerase (non-hydrolysing)